MRLHILAPVVSAALVLGACGSSDPGSSTSGAGHAWAEATILHLSGIRRNADFTYRLPGHPKCAATNLLRSSAEVQSYKDEGETVAANPDASAGVRVTGQSATCQRLFKQALAQVK
jgi:hypothetical protein